MNYLATIISSSILLCSCNTLNKSEINQDSDVNAEVISIEEGSTEISPCGVNYKDGSSFSISFYSIASGINYSSKIKLDSIITRFNIDNNDQISNAIEPWGREGELDYKFLSDSSEYSTFLLFKKKICFEMGNDSLVRFKEL